jgi:hypothetical protein
MTFRLGLAVVVLFAGGGASASGRASAATGSITVIRPENSGGMNLIPCSLMIQRFDGLVSAEVTHLGSEKAIPIKDLGKIDLIGGDTATLWVRPGRYFLSTATRLSDQPRGYTARKPHVWRSEIVNVVVIGQGNVRLSVLPTSAGSTGRARRARERQGERLTERPIIRQKPAYSAYLQEVRGTRAQDA